MNELYGKKYILRQRSSGYKSTIYAMAEIVDNAVDAKAKNIKIQIIEKEKSHGQRTRTEIDKIIFLDDGKGISEEKLNGCLTFSEGEGTSDDRIGSFGVGLPNSSISVGKKVEVYSRHNKSKWLYVFLDLDDQQKREKAEFDDAKEKSPKDVFKGEVPAGINTIIVWSKLDKLDASRAKTIIKRGEKLLGRIYRYKIIEGLKISISSYEDNNKDAQAPIKQILPYDPLFVTTNQNYATKYIWQHAQTQEKKGIHPELGYTNEEFTSKFHYEKFIVGCKENETTKSVFQKYDSYWDVDYKISLNGKDYSWSIKASFANSSLSKPGIRDGGVLQLGKMMKEKILGTKDFRSANIFFVRSGREIDFGSYGLYTVDDKNNRFWTIEIHFDSKLDELMGVSNTKQSVDFKYIENKDIDSVSLDEEISLGLQRERLWGQMSEKIRRAITDMKKHLAGYAKDFKDKEEAELAKKERGEENPIPQPEPVVRGLMTDIHNPWTAEQINATTDLLKSRYMTIGRDAIRKQVENHAKGETSSIVLYAPNEKGNLFEFTEIKGKEITLFNSEHIYYKNVIAPLKKNKDLRLYASALEMFLSSCALESNRLKIDNPGKYAHPLEMYLDRLSTTLKGFIVDSNIRIDAEEIERIDTDTDD